MSSAQWAWIQSFASRLLQLEPSCPESIAVAVGAIAYETDFGELPHQAAETHAAADSSMARTAIGLMQQDRAG